MVGFAESTATLRAKSTANPFAKLPVEVAKNREMSSERLAKSLRLLGLALGLTLTLLLGASGTAENEAMAGSVSQGAAACTERTSRQLVESFISSFNKGDTAQLDRLFSPDVFDWYSTDAPGARVNQEAYDRAGLMAYFAERHREHEQLKQESFQFNGESAGGLGVVGNFEFELTRMADGLAPTSYSGKGVIACWSNPHTIVRWSMGREPFLRARLLLYVSLASLVLAALAVGLVILFRWGRTRPPPYRDTRPASKVVMRSRIVGVVRPRMSSVVRRRVTSSGVSAHSCSAA